MLSEVGIFNLYLKFLPLYVLLSIGVIYSAIKVNANKLRSSFSKSQREVSILSEAIMKVTVELFLPFLIFEKTYRMFSLSELKWLMICCFAYVLTMFIAAFVNFFLSRIGYGGRYLWFLMVFNNVTYAGIPVLDSLMGERAVFLAILLGVVHRFFQLSVGIAVLKLREKSSKDKLLKILKAAFLNPLFLSFVLAVILNVTSLKLPQKFMGTISRIGDVAPTLMIVFLGMRIGEILFAGWFKNFKKVFLDLVVRLVSGFLIPTIVVIVLFKIFAISMLEFKTLFLLMSMPPAVFSYVLIEKYLKLEANKALMLVFGVTLLDFLVFIPIRIAFLSFLANWLNTAV